MFLQDAVSACSELLAPGDPLIRPMRQMLSSKCHRNRSAPIARAPCMQNQRSLMLRRAYEAAAVHSLLAGDPLSAARSMAKIGSVAALCAAAEICLLYSGLEEVNSRSLTSKP